MPASASAAAATTGTQPARAGRLAGAAAEHEVDALLVSAPLDVRWLTGYTGSNGMAVVGAGGDDGARLFFTDFRYATQIATEVGQEWRREVVAQDLLEGVARRAEELAGAGRLGFDADHLTVARHDRLRELLPQAWELVPVAGAVARLREVKDASELESIRAAAQLVDEVLQNLASRGLAGRTEREVALDVEHEMRVRGGQGPSFPTIVASGVHGALPHAQPRDEQIARDVLVTIDLGARVDGYCSDCTRTFATGAVSDEAREVYELVRRAQQAAVDALAPGLTGREADAVAREIIAAAGHGEHFGHGLGHGVGLDVHEGPRLSRLASERPLVAGNVVTVEPGVYLPDRLGVRIEDLVAVTADGVDVLSGFPKDLLDVG